MNEWYPNINALKEWGYLDETFASELSDMYPNIRCGYGIVTLFVCDFCSDYDIIMIVCLYYNIRDGVLIVTLYISSLTLFIIALE